MATLQRLLDRLWVLVLCGILIGAYWYQLSKHEQPCPLCMLQRLGMIGIAAGILLNLRFGVRKEHYGLALLASIFGCSASLRQIALHICPQFPTFDEPVEGYDLYVWAFLVFACSILATALLLMIFIFKSVKPAHAVWNRWDKLVFGLAFLVTFANVVTTLMECGLSPCKG